MSVVDRLEDALLMMQHQRMDGALHSVLTAIAGASRHRYPRGVAVSRRNPPQRMGDHEAFETFLEDQFGLTKTPRMRVTVDDIDRTFSSYALICPTRGVRSVFTGDWAARGVVRIGIDLATAWAEANMGERPITVILLKDNNTPYDLEGDWGAYWVSTQLAPQPGAVTAGA